MHCAVIARCTNIQTSGGSYIYGINVDYVQNKHLAKTKPAILFQGRISR